METNLEKVRTYEETDLPLTDSFAGFHSARDAEKKESVSNAVSLAGRVLREESQGQSVRWEETCRFAKPY